MLQDPAPLLNLPLCPCTLTQEEQGVTTGLLLLPVKRWHRGDALVTLQHESLALPGQASGGPGMPTSILKRCQVFTQLGWRASDI